MQLLELLRNKSFWLLDILKGGKIRRHYEDIKNILENHATANAQSKREQYLHSLLNHAKATVPFYKQVDGQATLSDFPVINKITIRENIDQFISDKYSVSKLIPVVTSGSTGTPFRVYHDAQKKYRNTADTIYFASKVGFKPGHRLYYFKIWNEINRKSFFESWLQNIETQDVTNLSAVSIEALLKKITENHSTKGFLGYASAYDALCTHIERHDIKPLHAANIKSIIAMSEGLSMPTKNKLAQFFNCPAVSRYSNVENGILAQQMADDSLDFWINSASYHVEVLRIEADIPAAEGTPGRIVVTDYFNYGMPLIRYDTGDIGILKMPEIPSSWPKLQNIEGRRMDMVYNTKGELVSSFTITNNMWKYTEIKQYQFIQKGAMQYLFKINPDGVFERGDHLIQEFKRYFGVDAIIEIEYVDEIPLLSSGKRKKVVNEYYQS